MNPTYLGEIPLDEDTLAHFGVKGMKWGRRKAQLKVTSHNKRVKKNTLDRRGISKSEQRMIKYGLGSKAQSDRDKRGARFMTDKEQTGYWGEPGKTVVMNPWTMDGSEKSSNLPNKRLNRRTGTRKGRRFTNRTSW